MLLIYICPGSTLDVSGQGHLYDFQSQEKVLSHTLIIYDDGSNEAVQAELWPQKLFTPQFSLSVVKALTLMSVQRRKASIILFISGSSCGSEHRINQNTVCFPWRSSCQSSFNLWRREIHMTWFHAVLSDVAVWGVFRTRATLWAVLSWYLWSSRAASMIIDWKHHFTEILTGFYPPPPEKKK